MVEMGREPTREDTDVIGARVGAQVVDIFFIFVIVFLIIFLFGMTGGLLGAAGGSVDTMTSIFTGLGLLVSILVFLGYSFILEAAWGGRTIGKKLFGIKVVKEDGSGIDTVSALLRNLPAVASLSWIAYLVALLSMASSDMRQRLFDRIAGTVVVKE